MAKKSSSSKKKKITSKAKKETIFPERRYFGVKETVPLGNLVAIQTDSYEQFFKEGLREVLDEISPILDFTGKNLELHFLDYYLEEPKIDEDTARTKNLTYKASLRVNTRLVNKITGTKKEQEVFFGDFPLMTKQGTFIINGVERVIVSQLIRSSGVLFTSDIINGEKFYGAKIIPARGAWLEFETNSKGVISVKIDRKRKIAVTALLRVFGLKTNEEILQAFADVDTDPAKSYIKATLERDPSHSVEEALVEIYKRLRPGDLATPENAKLIIEAMFFDPRRYDLAKVGRYKLNSRLNLNLPFDIKGRVLHKEDLIAVVKEIIRLNKGEASIDDIDHLKNRRVKTVGELVQARVRVGLLRMERIVKDRMSICDINTVTPAALINIRPLMAALQEFFASSQLSQFMDQTNPLAELEHKRRLSAMGPGGLSRERAGFDVRDVHSSHYGRICPIETPEGPNVGLVGHLACYARVNEYGFIETPYYKVKKIKNVPVVTSEIVYLDPHQEDQAIIAQANTKIDSQGRFLEDKVTVRKYGKPDIESPENVDYMDISPKQIVSIAAGLIPFIEHDDASRALMGANMSRQAVPLVKPNSPIVGTGLERSAALGSGHVVVALEDGIVEFVDGRKIIIKNKKGKKREYNLRNFFRSNQGTCITQRPLVFRGQRVKKGEVIADSSATDKGELALGQDLLVAFMSWGGANFEDAIIISERLVKEDLLTSIHIEKYSIDVRDTKLGPEIVTRDIPNVGEEALRNLDEDGIIRIGAIVNENDILVGKISPKGEAELTAEERLLRAIFGEKARDVKDTSLRLPHGEYGKVVDVKVFSRDQGDELPVGVIKQIEVSVAQLRKISVGDKLAGRHGNKGVISKILPVEDMPFLADGTPVDIILNPLGVISRMNIGQLLETHLGWAAKNLGIKVASPVFEGVPILTIKDLLKKANLSEDGKAILYDGRTGKPFDQPVTVGYIYIMKLIHLVDDKIHARSIGPYSMITQQPLGGKAQMGGQRFGEMEVWALEAYGAAHTLQEMLTVKSDDVTGRAKTYEAIIKGEPITRPSIPESFHVLCRELQSLGLSVDLIKKEDEK